MFRFYLYIPCIHKLINECLTVLAPIKANIDIGSNNQNQPNPSIIDNTQFELEQINMKINSLLHALDDIQTDIVKYKVDKRAEQEALQNQSISVSHYFRAFLMFMVCIGIPWFVIEVFSWRF